MSHFFVLVIVPDQEILNFSQENTENPIDKLLAQYNKSKWDWYQVGGRWTGILSGYEPDKDPDNIEVCDLCNGTGFRDDEIARKFRENGTWNQDYGCNKCNGTGKSVKWPSQRKKHAGDMQPVATVIEKKIVPFAVVSPDGEWHERGTMGGWAIVSDEKEEELWNNEVEAILLKYKENYTAVVVDCHI